MNIMDNDHYVHVSVWDGDTNNDNDMDALYEELREHAEHAPSWGEIAALIDELVDQWAASAAVRIRARMAVDPTLTTEAAVDELFRDDTEEAADPDKDDLVEPPSAAAVQEVRRRVTLAVKRDLSEGRS